MHKSGVSMVGANFDKLSWKVPYGMIYEGKLLPFPGYPLVDTPPFDTLRKTTGRTNSF